MESKYMGIIDGYPVSEAALYVYCDNCGSFNIKTQVALEKWIAIAIALNIAVLLSALDKVWIACCAVMGLPIAMLWKDIFLSYKCRNCGNEHITDNNSLHYPAFDKHVVDVPDRVAQKRYLDEDVPGFSRYA